MGFGKRITSIVGLVVFAFLAQQGQAEQMVMAIKKPDTLLRTGESTTIEQRALPESITRVSPRIVGGTIAPRGKYPEFASIWVDGLDGYFYTVCGASLIASNKVLTAAHCVVDFATYRIRVIPQFYSFNDNLSFSDLIPLVADTAHPGYSSSTKDNDIAVLTLARSSNTAKAKIFGGGNQLVGQMATVTGVGDTYFDSGAGSSVLREVNVPIVNNAVCNAAYGGGITSQMMCAGYSSGGKDACQGDSGGPLWVIYQGQRVQAGVVSFGYKCAEPNFYGVYARTSALRDFIKQYAPTATIQSPKPIVMAPVNYLLLSD